MGNSDHSAPDVEVHATSLTTAGEVWHAFVRDYTKEWPVAEFDTPNDVVQATADRWSGGRPGPWTRATVREWFIDGTQPGAKNAVDKPGLLYTRNCGGWAVDPVAAELGPQRWDDDVADWTRRARRGAGVRGEYGSVTAYWPGSSSWGGPLAGPCPERKVDGPDKPDDRGPDKPKPPKPDDEAPAPQEAATPPPEDDAAPAQQEAVTPLPEDDPTPAPQEAATPLPEDDPTPAPQEAATPLPEDDPAEQPADAPTPTAGASIPMTTTAPRRQRGITSRRR